MIRGLKPKKFLWILLTVALLTIAFRWICVTGIHRERITTQSEQENMGNMLLDLKNFTYLTNIPGCANDAFLVIFIHSAPEHLHHRKTIRETWKDADTSIPVAKLVFMLALPSNSSQERALERESRKHGDIVQGNFIDSYKNLTYKHTMGLQWASLYCPRAKYVIKMDDDIFVDIYQLVNLLVNSFPSLDNQITCYFQHQMPVVRDPVSKWYVSKSEYPKNVFDDYCSGWAYITSPKTAANLVKVASMLPYLWVDDVHITGTVAKKAGINRIRMNRYFALETGGLVEWTRSSSKLLWEKIFAPTWGDFELTEKANNKSRWCHMENCICCYSPTTPKPQQALTKIPPTGKSVVKLISSNNRKRVKGSKF